ncbi:MAG: alanine--tRNA ligase [Candidatus Nanopelagicales bacterium]|jgi:alanyl-tRNA synthetase
MDSAEIRRRFLAFFADRGHTVVPSASLLLDDPTLLFVNAGMVPFKPYFLGEAVPEYTRAASVQKCVRTLDIEEVGKTTRHASFFQMCGNFSFGDYFKETAIPLAWELLTSPIEAGGFGFAKERLWATVYEDDDESEQLWLNLTDIPAERIQRRGKADNFWSMGVPGPCGPCSEIYFDRGPEYGQEGGPVVDEDRYLEIWNLVFMQYARGDGQTKDDYPILGELPAKNIDTGAGLERIAALLQGVENIYEIDTTRTVLDKATAITGKHYGDSEKDDVALRVVADHSRTCVFMIADGVSPGNEGRGYVLRRITRRVINKMRSLGATEPVMADLIASVVEAMSPQYPELIDDAGRIAAIAANEESAFLETLRSGTTIFDNAVAEIRSAGGSKLPGDKAFLLHDTYGFPIDLTLEMAAESGMEVDRAGFTALMEDQRQRAKADARSRKAGLADLSEFRTLLDQHGPTDWLAYDGLDCDATVIGILKGDKPAPALAAGDVGTIVLDRTTFYAESGGQHADAGRILGEGVDVEVIDVQRPVKGLVAHQVRIKSGELTLDQKVHAEVDPAWRRDARQAHSGTHVVHAALREVLGPTALQSGSFNRPGYLRLDFKWTGGLSAQSRRDVEDVSNRAVRDDLGVGVEYMTLERAKKIGALALFGETYGDEVRVVEIGGAWSRELCGGTHVSSSAQIGPIAVTGESSIGSGTRRVEATVGLPAFEYLARERDMVSQLTDMLNVGASDLPQRISEMVSRLKEAERELDKFKKASLADNVDQIIGAPTQIGEGSLWLFEAPSGTGGGDLREIVQRASAKTRPDVPGAWVGAADADGKLSLVVVVNKAGQERGLTAKDLLAAVLPAVDGRGGGKPDVAQGGGTNPAGLPEGFQAARATAGERWGAPE